MTDANGLTRREAIAVIAAGTTAGRRNADPDAGAEKRKVPPVPFDYDVVIVGGGPAGLSAALVLGRSCRKVLVCDAGKPRNHSSSAVHGFFSRDGIRPAELLKVGREQLQPYAVEWHDGRVDEAEKLESGFRVRLGVGEGYRRTEARPRHGHHGQAPRHPGGPRLLAGCCTARSATAGRCGTSRGRTPHRPSTRSSGPR